jgi:hypothetical protein
MQGDTRATSGATSDILAGKYRIDAVMGSGGWGEVAARHIQLDEKVAIALPEAWPIRSGAASLEARLPSRSRASTWLVSSMGTLDTALPHREYLEGQDPVTGFREGRDVGRAGGGIVPQASEAIAEAHGIESFIET